MYCGRLVHVRCKRFKKYSFYITLQLSHMFNAEGRQAEEDKAGAETGAGAGVGEVGGEGGERFIRFSDVTRAGFRMFIPSLLKKY